MSESQLITDEYRELNTQLHDSRPDYGTSGAKYSDLIAQIYNAVGATSILDYGCGKMRLAHALPHLPIVNYDPCVPDLSERPKKADMVSCTDVLEHIEPDLLDNVLDDIQKLARKVVFFSIATRPAVKTLADGRNAHLIVEPYDWWLPKIIARWKLDTFNRVGNGEFIVSASNKEWNQQV